MRDARALDPPSAQGLESELSVPAEPRPRVLFFNEGNLGSHILGQSQLEAALRVGIASSGEAIDARFESLEPLGRWGHTVVTGAVPGLASRGLDQRALRFHLVQSLRVRRRLERELRADPPDVLHLHTHSIALLSGSIMRRLPVVLSLDATVRDWSSMPAWRAQRGAAHQIAPSAALERRALRAAALVTAWTEWAKRGVLAEQPHSNVIAHHPGLDLERYVPVAREPRARPRVLFVGGRFKEKGGEDLLAALQGLAGRELDLDLVTPQQVPQAEGITVHRLEAAAPELLRLYQQADVVALPTHGDTNPWVLLEAMACGTPAVSTDVGAIPELLDDGRAGVIVPLGEPRALREALTGLLADGQRREQLGRAARERCEQRYDARRQFPALAGRLRALAAGEG